MQDTDKVALDRVLKARAELIMTRTFYGVLVGQVTPVPSRRFPTMATDGKTHFFNPEFITSLPQTELLGVQAHESEHDARRHHTRRGGRDPLEWNICTDYAINIDLVDQGFKLPKGALVDPKYRGMSAEDIYRTREIERALEQQQQKDESPDADEDDEQDDADSESGQDEGDEGENEADDAGGQDGDEDGQDEGDGKGGDAPDGDDGQDGQDGQPGEGAGEQENGELDSPGTSPDGTELDGPSRGLTSQHRDEPIEAGNGTADDESAVAAADFGCGQVLDAAETSAEMATEDARWEVCLRQAAMLAAKRGDAPGHVAREIERADHPPQDWRETLRAYFDGGATTQETWARPNRRFIGGGLYLPGRQRDGVNRVVFMIDTSGSVCYFPGALEAIRVETQSALDEGIIDQAVVLYGDTRVTRVDEYRGGDEIEFDPRGGGGTVMRPLFNYVAEQVDDASLIVAFTDLEIEPESELGPEPHCPVLWAAVGYPASVKEYLKNTPWGSPGIEIRPDVG